MKVIDVSYHDGDLNFKKIKAAGIDSVIIRAGYGKKDGKPGFTQDVKFEDNMKKAIAAGMNIGIYWFGYAYSLSQAKKEADNCLAIIAPYKKHIKMPVFYDWEYDSMNYAKSFGHIIPNRKLITAMIAAFMKKVKKAGYKTGFYFNKDYQNNHIDVDDLDGVKWYARYKSALNTEEQEFDLWQFTETGKVDGIGGTHDLNKVLNAGRLGIKTKKKKTAEIAKEVINGLWGNGADRKERLTEAGYNYDTIQKAVNKLLKG